MKHIFIVIAIFTLLNTGWSMDTTQGSNSHGSPSGNKSPDRIRGLGRIGRSVEKHLQRQKVPKDERANVRWNKLQQFTGIEAKQLERHKNARDKLLTKLNSPTHIDTQKYQQTGMYHDYHAEMVHGHRDVLHNAESDLKVYQRHKSVPEHASIPALRKVIREKNPSYLSPPPSPVREPGYYDSDTSSASSSPSSTPTRSPARQSSP